tara:strand:+ start:544 stop:1650 length:1107 start_codon:yes stop_codon:yes gene_type:complete
MSTLKVGAIRGVSASSDAITVANDGTATANITNRQHRNLIINGAMNIHQRATSSYTLNSGGTTAAYPVDRFKMYTGNGTIVASQSTTVPAGQGFAKSIKLACTATDASPSAETYLQYLPESQDFVHLAYGTSGAKTVTVSFWVRSSLAATYGFYYYMPDTNRAYQTTFTISSQNTWEKKTLTIVGDTAGSGFNNDNGIAAEIRIYLANGPGSSGSAHQNAWGTDATNRLPDATNFVSSTSNDFYITGFQMEAGTVATDFEFKSFNEELALCRRYYYKSFPYDIVPARNLGNTDSIFFPVVSGYNGAIHLDISMRTAPTITFYNPSADNGSNSSSGAGANNRSTDNGIFIEWGNVAGNSYCQLVAEAEL